MWIKTSTGQLTIPPKSLEIAVFAECPGTKDYISVCKPKYNWETSSWVWCGATFFHSALKPLMISNSTARDPHYIEITELQFLFSAVPAAGSPAASDSTQRCHHRHLSPAWHQTLEGKRADAESATQLMAAISRSCPPFFFFFWGGVGAGRYPTAEWSSLVYRSNKLAFETAVPLLSHRVFIYSRPSNNACLFQTLLTRALFWAHSTFKHSKQTYKKRAEEI